MARTNQISTDAMLRELGIVFPTLWKRRLSEFGGDYATSEGVWTGSGHCSVMPDGDGIFNTLAHDGEAPYSNSPVNDGFAAWLENHGWAWEDFDGETIFLLPLSAFDAPFGDAS